MIPLLTMIPSQVAMRSLSLTPQYIYNPSLATFESTDQRSWLPSGNVTVCEIEHGH